jgi:hypothetical protein
MKSSKKSEEKKPWIFRKKKFDTNATFIKRSMPNTYDTLLLYSRNDCVIYSETSKQENRFSEKKVQNTKLKSVTYMTMSLASEEFSSSNSLILSWRFVFCCIVASSTLLTHNSGEKNEISASVLGQEFMSSANHNSVNYTINTICEMNNKQNLILFFLVYTSFFSD